MKVIGEDLELGIIHLGECEGMWEWSYFGKSLDGDGTSITTIKESSSTPSMPGSHHGE